MEIVSSKDINVSVSVFSIDVVILYEVLFDEFFIEFFCMVVKLFFGVEIVFFMYICLEFWMIDFFVGARLREMRFSFFVGMYFD